MDRRKSLTEGAEKMRQVRLNQPSATSEDMRAQLEKNRSEYAAKLQSPKGARSWAGRKATA